MKNNGALTKRELKKAARLFTLMTIGQFDCGGVNTNEEIDVLSEAVDTANEALLKEFPEIEGYFGQLSSCIEHIKGMRK
jgi:hypothetical protein